MADHRLLLGIDKGTSVVKSVVFDVEGRQVVRSARRIEALHASPGNHEEDPNTTWGLTLETIRECMDALGERTKDVAGVGLVGHSAGAWFVGEDGRPTRASIAWTDARARDVVSELEQGSRYEEYLDIACTSPLEGMTAMLLNAVAREEPDLLRRTKHVLNAKDYIRLQLTGSVSTEPSDASWWPFDPRTGTLSTRLLEILGAEAWGDRLPPIRRSDAIHGRVSAAAADATGIPTGTPVAGGLSDVPAALVGSGISAPGGWVSVLGTSWLSVGVVDDPADGVRGVGWPLRMPNDRYAYALANTSGASTFDWWLDQLGSAFEDVDGSIDFAKLESAVRDVPEAQTRLVFLPYLSAVGIQAPFKDQTLRGTLLGLEHDTSRAEVFRAVYEGMAYSMKDCYDVVGERPLAIRLSGGGASSTIWPAVLSNLTGAVVETPESDEPAALGAVIMAAVALGVRDDMESAQRGMVRIRERIEPDPHLHRLHLDQFERFKRAQHLARDFFAH
ncbi:FGGY-family carbohydrate kinase [Aeromicrobium sp. CF4.19]|uniref:FGGY-family carbohydrate kinase n=1 Tax=Aeromicrobium sp. CF4.19 TaxID=3373082 RepID=UPI003EE49B9C